MDHPTPDRPQGTSPAAGEAAQSRRAFFQKTAMVAAPAALLAASAGPAQAASSTSLQIPNLYSGWNARNFSQIRADENTHVAFLQATLGANALPALPLNTAALTLPATEPIFFAAYASVFENTDTATYLGAAPLLYSRANLAASAAILGIEGYHSGYLNTLVDFPVVQNDVSFYQPFTPQQTLLNVSPFFADPSQIATLANNISMTPSPANDIAILNFALALERLGATFYNINVPRFFGV